MYRIFNSIHKYPGALCRVRVCNAGAQTLPVRVAENVSVSSLLFSSLLLPPLSPFPSVPLFLFFPLPLSPPCTSIYSPRSLPRSLISFSRFRELAAERERTEREEKRKRDRELRKLPVSYYGKNEVAYFLCLVTNRLSSPGRRPENETKILLAGRGAPRREK